MLDDFATTSRLRALGLTKRDIERAVRSGKLIRARRGLYSTRAIDDQQVIAARVGGQLTGVSAIAALGGWLPRPPSVLHVSVPRTHSRLRFPVGQVIVHWVDRPAAVTGIADLHEILVRVVLDEDLETAVSCFDWAFASGHIDTVDFEIILRSLPSSARALRAWVDPRSQSVLESVARVRILQRGWAVRSQVRVGDLQAIDLVVEDHVALELDGRAHHEARFESDRRKDLAITREGRHSIRVTASMLWNHWADVEAAISCALEARQVVPSAGTAPVEPRGKRRAARSRPGMPAFGTGPAE